MNVILTWYFNRLILTVRFCDTLIRWSEYALYLQRKIKQFKINDSETYTLLVESSLYPHYIQFRQLLSDFRHFRFCYLFTMLYIQNS